MKQLKEIVNKFGLKTKNKDRYYNIKDKLEKMKTVAEENKTTELIESEELKENFELSLNKEKTSTQVKS